MRFGACLIVLLLAPSCLSETPVCEEAQVVAYAALTAAEPQVTPEIDPTTALPTTTQAIERLIDRMTPEQRVSQLLFVRVNGTRVSPEVHKLLAQQVGGIVLYADNIESEAQVRQLTRSMAPAPGVLAPFIAVDHEGGVVRRLDRTIATVPSAMALGATRSPELALRAGIATGLALHDLGFTMNFAPVLDVLPPGGAGSLETRAFSDDPALAASLGAGFIQGQNSAGIISVAKHFPGIGGAAEDTHHVLPVLDRTRRDLDTRELLPFRAAIDGGLQAIMTGHVALPRLTGKNDLPATLSPEIMTTLLRDQLHFGGVVISDALQMKAISSERDAGPVAVRAIQAGCDMVLALGGVSERQAVYAALLRALRDGTITDERIRVSLRRILALKAQGTAAPVTGPVPRDNLGMEIAHNAVTLEGDRALMTALRANRPVYVGMEGILADVFTDPQKAGRSVTLPPHLDPLARARLLAAADAALRNAPLWLGVAQTDDQWQFLRAAAAAHPDVPFVYVNLGSPHRLVPARSMLTVYTYASSIESQQAAADVLLGKYEARGTLPSSDDQSRCTAIASGRAIIAATLTIVFVLALWTTRDRDSTRFIVLGPVPSTTELFDVGFLPVGAYTVEI